MTLLTAKEIRPRRFQEPSVNFWRRQMKSAHSATWLAAVLTAAGIAADRLLVEAHGSQDECGEGEDLDAYAMDRRVTVRLERVRAETVASNE